MILETYGDRTAELTLVPAHGGRFEVTVDSMVLFSKAALHRHADPNEVLAAIQRGEAVTA
jgi:predicted Rdx family selenoprotein